MLQPASGTMGIAAAARKARPANDEEVLAGLRLLLERTKTLVEPAGAAATAAFLTGKAGARSSSRAVATLSGGNVDSAKLKCLL